jgi:predicted dehydrogenase
MDKALNVAIVGAGYWGTKLIREYLLASKERENIVLKAICDINSDRLKRIEKEISLPKSVLITNNYEDIITHDEINAIHIATPSETHYGLALEAINANKHIVLEKPMTLSSREAFNLVRNSEKRNIILLVDYIFRFNNALKKTIDLLKRNEFGDLYYITLKWSDYLELPRSRDIIFDLGPHPIDIINNITEEWPKRVYGVEKGYRKDFAEVAFINAEIPNNILVNIELSWVDRGKKTRTVNIVTEKGTLVVDALNQTIMFFSGSQEKSIPVAPNNTIRDMIYHFADNVINDEPPLNSANIGALNVLVLEKVRESVEKSQTIEIFRG